MEAAARQPSLSAFAILRRAALPLVLIAGVGAWYGQWSVAAHSDQPSAAEARQRQLAFEALSSLDLRSVEPGDLDAAIDGMGLTPAARKSLVADLAASPQATAQAAPVLQPSPEAQPAAVQSKPLRLAWVTLWDTDVEDGDVVRLDSGGYSRTVVLTKHTVTFAVPVPESGVITITGINDGDGGGITVGLASGNAQAILPIMSPGQTLRLAVAIR